MSNANTDHSAEASALGFFYQSLYALDTLLGLSTDNAAISIETLDDVQLDENGKNLLFQLKHSIKRNPTSLTIKSKSLWKTFKAWIDVLPKISLSETKMHLVVVGKISEKDPLNKLLDLNDDRATLLQALENEAIRVLDERKKAQQQKKRTLPYADRKDGCEAFMKLKSNVRKNLLDRVFVIAKSPNINEIEKSIAAKLTLFPSAHQTLIAKKLVEWWDRQVIYSLSGVRERYILRSELQSKIMEIAAEIEHEKLMPEFERSDIPTGYIPHAGLIAQIDLVKGRDSDKTKAIREEWRAREQRSKWVRSNPGTAVKIFEYDALLKEYWEDKHISMCEDNEDTDEESKCKDGLELLRWTHNDAPNQIRSIEDGWSSAYYIRGSYQVLAINLTVGWHPDYKKRLKK
ncbi:hypothetical protein PA3_25610 [Acinetobacter pittii]|uniref:ABC-three component systems C-terminal domain-containing protein n=1 Tax=Acinetobacter pittii TaxID=48296 RepID=A0A4Y3J9C7_ACIPI|nr:ABC-three component system protein [Acinetobacter pittii]GEA68403.1 hypothetical protein PA3_25610 [Acinetobacter pittii]